MGFLEDLRRLNVAITRPRHFLFIVGNCGALNRVETWAKMIKLCEVKKEDTDYGVYKIPDLGDKYHERYISRIREQTLNGLQKLDDGHTYSHK